MATRRIDPSVRRRRFTAACVSVFRAIVNALGSYRLKRGNDEGGDN